MIAWVHEQSTFQVSSAFKQTAVILAPEGKRKETFVRATSPNKNSNITYWNKNPLLGFGLISFHGFNDEDAMCVISREMGYIAKQPGITVSISSLY